MRGYDSGSIDRGYGREDDDQVTLLINWLVLLSLKVPTAEYCKEMPLASDDEVGDTAIDASALPVIVIASAPAMPDIEAETVTGPGVRADNKPDEETTASLSFEVDHAAVEVMTAVEPSL